MCDEINQVDSETFEHSFFPHLFYRTGNNIKSDLTVSNLIQFIPNIFTYDFQIFKENQLGSQTELPQLMLPQSLSFMRAQSIMQSINKSMNHRTLKINLNLEKNSVKCEDPIKENFNLASKYDINLIYHCHINTFLNKFNRLLTSVNYLKPLKESVLDLKIEFDREIDDKSFEYEEKILLILEAVLDNVYDVFESFFKIGNIKDHKLFKTLCMINYEFDNEHNPINYLIASFIFKYLKNIVVKFDLNSPEEDLFKFSPETLSLIISVKFNDIPGSKEKSIFFLSSEQIFNLFCSILIKKELNFITESFSNFSVNNSANAEIIYDNRNLHFTNSNLPCLMAFLHNKKYFKKIEFLNKLKTEDLENEKEKILICLVLFEFIVYMSILAFKVVNILNKNAFNGTSNLKYILDLKTFETPNKDPSVFFLNLQLNSLNFLKLITSNYNTIETLLSQGTILEYPLECTISYADAIIPIKKDTSFIKIKIFTAEDLNSYIVRLKIPNKNLKIRSILINSSTLESFISSSSSIDSENDDRFFEIKFEKLVNIKPQKYFLNTYLNNNLINETQILLTKPNIDNAFYPLINNLFMYSKQILLGENATFIINNSPTEEGEDLKESIETPKKYNPNRKILNKDLNEYIDFQVKFKPMKINSEEIIFKFSELPNQRPCIKLNHHLILEKKPNYDKKPKRFLGDKASILTKWLNSNILFVNFSSNVVSELTFSFPDNVQEPHHMVYDLKNNEYESKNPIKYIFATSK